MFNNYNYNTTSSFIDINKEIELPKMDYNSFYRAIVESIEDPEHLGRIKIRIPSVHGTIDSRLLPYAYPAIFVGLGYQTGQFILPPVGSIVFVTFEYSEEHRPIYFGGVPTTYAEGKEQFYGNHINNGQGVLVTGDDIPTEYTGTQYIIYKSPSGSIIYIDDNDLKPKMILKDSLGQKLMFISNDISDTAANGYIKLQHDEDNYIKIADGETIICVAGKQYSVPWSTGQEGTSDYNSLQNLPVLNTNNIQSQSAKVSEQIKGTINLHKISKTGDYNDLLNKPTIPAEQVNADWNATTGKAQILNKPSLSNVATSGQYQDLLNKPDIPTKTTDLTNDSRFITIDDVPNPDWSSTSGKSQILNKPTIPSKLSQLANDQDFITFEDIPPQVNADWNATEGPAQILNKPTIPSITGLEKTSNKVAVSASSTSEQYPNAKSVYDLVQNSISSIPAALKIPTLLETESSLPTTGEDGDYYFIQNMDITDPNHTGRAWYNNNQWYKVIDMYSEMDGVSIVLDTNGSYKVSTNWLNTTLNLATVATSGNYSDLNGIPLLSTVATTGEYSDLKNKPTLPTKVSDLENDLDFITEADIPPQVNADWNSQTGISQILNKPDLSNVATSGDYNDLSNTPTYKTINGESILGTGNITVSGSVEDQDKLVYSDDKSINNILTVTKAQYDSLKESNQLDNNTYYNITDDTISALTSTPLGAIVYYAGPTETIPSNYLPCNGQQVSQADYLELYTILGDTYGATETQFTLPNCSSMTSLSEGSYVIKAKSEAYTENLRNLDTEINSLQTQLNTFITQQLNEILLEKEKAKHPIGTLEFNTTGTNPSTYLGFGTWTLWGSGKVLAGVNESDPAYSSGEKTGGSKTVTLTTSNLPSHTHTTPSHTHTYAKANTATGSTTLTVSQMPTHTHKFNWPKGTYESTTYNFFNAANADKGGNWIGDDQFMLAVARKLNSIEFPAIVSNSNLMNDVSISSTGSSAGHNHSISTTNTNTGASSGTTGATGSASPINITPEYITCYIFKRTA